MKSISNVFICIIICLILSVPAYAKEYEKTLLIELQVNNPTSTKIIDHKFWQLFISKYVVPPVEGLSLVKYARVTPNDHLLLKKYILTLANINIKNYNRNEQLAYWLNLYNALVIKLILEHYPIKTIQELNLSPGLFSSGPWNAKIVQISNFNLSLNDIKNKIIRAIWNDTRTLYALCNSSIGGPNISNQAYNSLQLSEQLNQASYNFINSPRGVQITQNKLLVSKLFEWYEEDFGGTKQDVIKHLKLFAKPHLKKKLELFKTINNYNYNWHLNSKIDER